MSGRFLYCQNCGNYLGSLGGDSCHCGWNAGSDPDDDDDDSAVMEAAPAVPAASLIDAAQAVLDRWNSPKWDWHKQGPTADLMAALTRAIESGSAAVPAEGGGEATASRAFAWGRLYDAVNQMMAPLGYHGEICARDDRVSWVMKCLRDLDGGEYIAGLMPAVVQGDGVRMLTDEEARDAFNGVSWSDGVWPGRIRSVLRKFCEVNNLRLPAEEAGAGEVTKGDQP